jgi:hypothetical protein
VCYRATLRADIWIPRPGGSVCRKKRLTRCALSKDIAADFARLRLRVPNTPPEEPAIHLELMKVRTVSSLEEIDNIVASVTQSANKALMQVSQLGLSKEGLRTLWSMKIDPVGCDPVNSDDPLNLIEQLNQTFTYIASARAAKLLLSWHPDLAPLTLNLGTSPGSDIESNSDGGLAAEVFAAVNTSNNRKLAKDIEKVGRTQAHVKYVFFMCPGYDAGRQPSLETRSDVMVWSVGATL